MGLQRAQRDNAAGTDPPLQSMQSYTLLLMMMQRALVDLMTLDICGMATGKLADRVASVVNVCRN